MPHLSRPVTALVLVVALLAGCNAEMPTSADLSNLEEISGTASAHESNNRAELSGMQDGASLTGSAIVNYVKGAAEGDLWRSNVNVKGNLAAGTYDFYVLLVNMDGVSNETLVCSFDVTESGGRQGCNADTDLPGFNTAEVREADGDIVASGTFARRGGNRE